MVYTHGAREYSRGLRVKWRTTIRAVFDFKVRLLYSECFPEQEEWPAEIGTWLKRNGFAIPEIPPHSGDCSGLVAGRGPIVVSPSEDSEYHIRAGIPLEHQKISLAASVSNRTKQVFWFLDG